MVGLESARSAPVAHQLVFFQFHKSRTYFLVSPHSLHDYRFFLQPFTSTWIRIHFSSDASNLREPFFCHWMRHSQIVLKCLRKYLRHCERLSLFVVPG